MAKRFFIFILIFVFCLDTSITFAAKKIDAAKDQVNAKDELGDIKEKIEALKKELDNNQAAHKDATDALKDSETAISVSNEKLFEIAKKQKQNKNQLATLKTQSLSINQRLSLQQSQLSQLARQQYMHGKQSYAQLILQNKNPSEITRELKYFSYVAKSHAALINNMQGNLNKVADLNSKTTDALKEVAELRTKQEAEKKELLAQSREKSKVVSSLSNQIAAQRNEIDKLKRDEKSLSSLVERLAKIVPPKKHSSKKVNTKKKSNHINNDAKDGDAKENNKDNTKDNGEDTIKDSDTVVANNDTLPNTDVTGIHFANLRGKLHLPVRGDVTNRFGNARADTGVSWKGLFIKAPEGNEVKTVADGRVVFADWMRGFGNLIIVDHGSGYMSLYGNNQAVLKHVGDEVDAGDAIASVGNSGGNESNGLYYELRHNSQPFDPMSWSIR